MKSIFEGSGAFSILAVTPERGGRQQGESYPSPPQTERRWV